MLGYMLAGGMKGAGDAFIKLGAEARERARKLEDEQRKEAALDRQTRRNTSQMREVLGLGDAPEAKDPSFPLSQRKGLSFGSDVPSMTRGTASGEELSFGQSNLSGNKAEFVNSIMPYAQRVGSEIGVDPRIIVAQAALESGWGRSAPGNNYFGIKSHGRAGGNTLATKEVVNGETISTRDSFRAYNDIEQSVEDYGNFLRQNPRYREMLSAGDIESQINALQASGYATDPNYGAKIRSIVQEIGGVPGQMDGAAYDRLPLSMGNGVSIAPPERQQAVNNAEIERLVEIASDERASSQVRAAAANRINQIQKGQISAPEKLTGKTRGSDWSLGTTEINQIGKFLEEDQLTWQYAPSSREMAAEVQRLMKADDTLTLIDAYSVAANAWQGVEVTETATEKSWLGGPTEVTNTRQEFDFRYGLGDAPPEVSPPQTAPQQSQPEPASEPSTGSGGRVDRRGRPQQSQPDALKMPSDPSQLENGRIYLHPQTGQAIRWNAETQKFEVL